jgi:hydroxymethylpyrimidine pyrophosphatase-like HAD family hydrolase
VLLPWADWSIHRQLEPEAVGDCLARLLNGRRVEIVQPDGRRSCVTVDSVESVQRLPLEPITDLKAGSPVRRHTRARYRVRVASHNSGSLLEAEVYAKGTGLGYLGRYALAVSDQLPEFVPPSYGIDGACLFRGWLSDDQRLTPRCADAAGLARRVAAYVVARRDRLATGYDPSERISHGFPAWRRATVILERPLGRARLLIRPGRDRLSRRLLGVSKPAVVDGSMALTRWYGTERQALKVDYDERAYAVQDSETDEMYSYDPVFDIAGAAADYDLEVGERGAFPSAVRHAYEQMTGDTVDEERWMVHRTVQLRCYVQTLNRAWAQASTTRERHALATEMDAALRSLSRVHQDYLAAMYFTDTVNPDTGGVCAIDIDGVLESGRLGYPTMTPAAALGLRALARHGHRIVLATGRSLSEVRERCAAFGLAGGVAEYGAAIYDHNAARDTILADGRSCAGLNRIRSWLLSQGAFLDPSYQHIVRASTRDSSGNRRPIDANTVVDALDRAAGAVTAVTGLAQVDFLPRGIGKASGLQTLLQRLGAADHLEMAVGDTLADLPMLQLAKRAYAPANARPELRRAGVMVMSRPLQAGFAQAVALFIGHRPGTCSECRPLPVSPPGRILLGALVADDMTRMGKLLQAMRLNVEMWR